MFESAINDKIDEIVEDRRKKIKQVIKDVELSAKKRIEEMIPEYMTEKYYSEYSPRFYTRTDQLINSVGPYTEVTDKNNVLILSIGVEDDSPYGARMMHHKGKRVNERKIQENFLSGIHPNAEGIGKDFQGTNIEENIKHALYDLVKNELKPMIESGINAIK